MDELELATYTLNSRKSLGGRLAWWTRRATARNIGPFPLAAHKLNLTAALLRRGKYKTSAQYLYTIKKEHLRQGHPWDDALGGGGLEAELRA